MHVCEKNCEYMYSNFTLGWWNKEGYRAITFHLYNFATYVPSMLTHSMQAALQLYV